jgi:hypothetical protein
MTMPASVYAEETTLQQLGTAELLLVTVLRLWVSERNGASAGDPALDWRPAFGVAHVKDGIPAFACLMDIIASAALRTVHTRPRQCSMLGSDEARLLQLISLLQRDRHGPAADILADFLPPTAVRLALRVSQVLAATLATAGLIVPLRHAEAAAYLSLAPSAHATPGLALMQ